MSSLTLSGEVNRVTSTAESGVDLLGGGLAVGGAHAEVAAAVVVEQRGEHARRIEPGRGKPVHDPLGRDERGGLQVADQSVLAIGG